jgi:predicted dinucleotide-binding enzyme
MNKARRRFLKIAGATAGTVAVGSMPVMVRAAAASGRRKIGIIGSGSVGSALGTVWADAGHEVMFSSRHLKNDQALAAKLGSNARAGTPQQAAAFGDVVVMSVPYGALPELGKGLADQINGKVLIDTCNPFPARDGEIATWAREKGAGLASAELLKGARIVRAFNAVGARRMATAHTEPGQIGMPVAGDDEEAIAVASRLIRDVGYEPVVIGGLEMGKFLMPGTPLAGERTPEEIRRIAGAL